MVFKFKSDKYYYHKKLLRCVFAYKFACILYFAQCFLKSKANILLWVKYISIESYVFTSYIYCAKKKITLTRTCVHIPKVVKARLHVCYSHFPEVFLIFWTKKVRQPVLTYRMQRLGVISVRSIERKWSAKTHQNRIPNTENKIIILIYIIYI